MSKVKILLLTKYGRMGASSRMRSIQYEPFFIAAGYEFLSHALLSDDLLAARYRDGGYGVGVLVHAYFERIKALFRRRNFDVVWIEKEALPWWPASIEKTLLSGVPYILDYDDAVFHNYDMHSSKIVRVLFGSRLDKLMAGAIIVTAGNNYLKKRAIDAGANCVKLLPTVVDLQRYYSLPASYGVSPLCIVWIGSPSTAHYLNILYEPLRRLAATVPFVLRIIGAQSVVIPGIQIETVSWTEDTEVDSIASCAIGIMPLEDSPWEQGKCGYKLIQYMACGLPVVASAVGANLDIVEDGQSGFLVRSPNEWVAALSKLLISPELRSTMGRAGRARVEEKYCLQKTGPELVELLRVASTK